MLTQAEMEQIRRQTMEVAWQQTLDARRERVDALLLALRSPLHELGRIRLAIHSVAENAGSFSATIGQFLELSKDGRNFALHEAARSGTLSVVQEIMSFKDKFDENQQAAIDLNFESLEKWTTSGFAEDLGIAMGAGTTPIDLETDDRNSFLTSAFSTKGSELLNDIKSISDQFLAAGETALIVATRNGHSEIASLLLENGADPNQPNRLRDSPLLFATRNGDVNVVRALLSHGAEPDQHSPDGETLLMIAARNGYSEIAASFLRKGVDPNRFEEGHGTALLLAIQSGSVETVGFLLEHGADPNQRTLNRDTALMNAVRKGSAKMVRALLERRAYPDVTGEHGEVALHYLESGPDGAEIVRALVEHGVQADLPNATGDTALLKFASSIQEDAPGIVEALLKNGADPARKSANGDTALHCTARSGSFETLSVLLSRGVEPEVKNASGETPIMLAAKRGAHDLSYALLTNGAALDVVDENGVSAIEHLEKHQSTCLTMAAERNNFDLAARLIKAGASVHNCHYMYGSGNAAVHSPLHAAAKCGHVKVLRLILDACEDPDVVDIHGSTALVYASSQGHNENVQLLLKTGAAIDHVNKVGRSPLMLASLSGHMDTVSLLLENGARLDLRDQAGTAAQDYALRAGWRGLTEAASTGNLAQLKKLLDQGADPNLTPEAERSALFQAVEIGHLECVSCLINAGADLRERDDAGETAFIRALRLGDDQMAELLMKGGSCLNGRDNDGLTFLHRATKQGETELVRKLLQYGADPDQRDDYGETVLVAATNNGNHAIVQELLSGTNAHVLQAIGGRSALMVASELGHNRIAESLLASGVNPNWQTPSGKTPLIHAVRHGQIEMVSFLLDHGANPGLEDYSGRIALDYAEHNSNLSGLLSVPKWHRKKRVPLVPQIPGNHHSEEMLAKFPARFPKTLNRFNWRFAVKAYCLTDAQNKAVHDFLNRADPFLRRSIIAGFLRQAIGVGDKYCEDFAWYSEDTRAFASIPDPYDIAKNLTRAICGTFFPLAKGDIRAISRVLKVKTEHLRSEDVCWRLLVLLGHPEAFVQAQKIGRDYEGYMPWVSVDDYRDAKGRIMEEVFGLSDFEI